MALLKRQQKILDTYFDTVRSSNQFFVYDELPTDVRRSLENIKPSETLWCDSERYLSDKQTQFLCLRRV
jgi:hypothetical protein